MKSKPKVMEHFSTVHTSYILNFDFTNNITVHQQLEKQHHFHL